MLAFFDLLVVVGGAADKSKIPLVSLFGTIVKAFGEVGQEMLKQVLSLGKRIRNREGNCVGLATHAQGDERETALHRDVIGGDGIRICPIATRGHLQDVYVSAQPDDATQLYFWVKDKFITGRKGGGGVMGMRRAIQLIRAGEAIGYKAYTGNSKDIGTIAMVYNTPYPEEKLRGRDRVDKTGVAGLLEEADKVIDEIAAQINNLEGATDTFGENGCSEEKMRDYLKKETGKRIKEFIKNYRESSRKLKDLYALAFVEKHRKNISGAPKRQSAYKTYSRFWDKIEKISLFKIRVILVDESRNDGKCPRCAGARIEISVSNGKELAGCEVDKADSRGGFVTQIVTGKNTVTAKISAEAKGKSGTLDIDPEKLFGGLGGVPFIREESYRLRIPFEEEKKKEEETVKGNEILDRLIAAAAEAERVSNELLTSCQTAQAKAGEARALMNQLKSAMSALKNQVDELTKKAAQVAQLVSKVKSLAAADQAAALIKFSAEIAGEISGLRKKTGELKSKAGSVSRLIGEARDAAAKAAGLNPSMDEIAALGRSMFSQGTQAVESIKETELGKDIARKLNGALGRISAATARAGNCSAESEKTVDQVDKENKIFKAELEPLIAKALSLTKGAKPGESVEDLVADASAAADTAEIFSEAAAGSAIDAKTCVRLARAVKEKGSEKISQTAQVAIDICDFKKAKSLIEALPPGPGKTRLHQAYLTKTAYENQTKALFNAGKKLYKQGEFTAALTKFQEAKTHTHCKNFIASLDAAIAKVIAKKAEIEKDKKDRQKEANAKCDVRLSGSAAHWSDSARKYSCACPSDKVKNADKTACVLKTDGPPDSELKVFAVAFKMYILKPIHKPKTIKAPPGADKQARERIKRQNKRIVKSFVSGLSLSNTKAEPMDEKQGPMFIAIGEGGWETYPREIFLGGAKFSAPVKGALSLGKSQNIPLDMAILMTVTHVYENMDELFAAYPEAGKQAQAQGGAELLKQAMINDSAGTFTVDSPSGKITFGPLARGWTSANMNKALQMAKLMATMMAGVDCFVATAVYGDRYAPQLDTLRHFRDDFLLPTESGSRLVSLYYKYGPGLAEEALKHPVIVSGLRKGLDIFVDWLEKKDQRDSLGGKVINGLANITDKFLSMAADETGYAKPRQAPAFPLFKIPNSHKPARQTAIKRSPAQALFP